MVNAMKFIIKDGEAYIIKDNVAKLIKFDNKRNMNVIEKETIDNIKGFEKYSYDEILKKLNVDYNIKKSMIEERRKRDSEELLNQIDELQLEIKSLKDQIETIQKENNQLKEQLEKTTSKKNENSKQENNKE